MTNCGQGGTLSGAASPTAAIAANDPAMLAGIRVALEADGIGVVAQATSIQEIVEAVEAERPAVVLLDADLADGGGVLAAAEIMHRTPGVAVVLLANDAGEDHFLDAMRVGVNGYLSQSIAPARLGSVVRAVVAGEAAIPRALVSRLLDSYRNRAAGRALADSDGRSTDLTSREWEVLDLIRDGLSTREIATCLFISEVTVRRHTGSILKKLEVSSRADALRLLGA